MAQIRKESLADPAATREEKTLALTVARIGSRFDGHLPSDGYGFIANLLEAPESAQLNCSRRLVVESITVVDGP